LKPLVSIIIPHFNNFSIISECLESLEKITYQNYEIIVVDNCSNDDSYNLINKNFKNINLFKTDLNLGFSGGCNFGSNFARGKYLLFLNNDTIHNPNFIEPLVQALEENRNIASVQPKINNYDQNNFFDYAGASGGYIDYLVYPYCRGRIFDTIEKDSSQYNDIVKVFWTSGTAFLTRKIFFKFVKGFDEKLFCHMEEIDYCWKNYLRGYENYVIPTSVIYHKGGKTLNYNNSYKKYLNHRNSIILLLTNFELGRSVLTFLIRFILEVISSLVELIKLKPYNFILHYKTLIFLLFNFNYIIKRRKFNKKIRVVKDYELFKEKIILNNSIVKKYFLFRMKKFNEIHE